MGFFPHSVLLRLPLVGRRQYSQYHHSTFPERGRVGVLLGKRPDYFLRLRPVLEALIEQGFTLHTTCGAPCDESILPAAIIRHTKNLSPRDYIQLLRKASFLLGAGKPYDSPSPFEALAVGTAFLNPWQSNVTLHLSSSSLSLKVPLRAAQHTPLALLGPPYVYSVHLDNVTSVLEAAEMAVQYRFASYVPPDYQPLAVVARVCSLLQEMSTLCHDHDNNDDNNNNNNNAAVMDSRFYSNSVRKSVAGYDSSRLQGVNFYGTTPNLK